mmetsp:Transcript_30563/g.65858  ORF Transcript_30563/g.65858 Transcript_30563/m.65858 type:complete len:405 (+) Transcript_30563:113-1327(+)
MANGPFLNMAANSVQDSACPKDGKAVRPLKIKSIPEENVRHRLSGPCPKVVVRNSFLDVVDPGLPVIPKLTRSKTYPTESSDRSIEWVWEREFGGEGDDDDNKVCPPTPSASSSAKIPSAVPSPPEKNCAPGTPEETTHRFAASPPPDYPAPQVWSFDGPDKENVPRHFQVFEPSSACAAAADSWQMHGYGGGQALRPLFPQAHPMWPEAPTAADMQNWTPPGAAPVDSLPSPQPQSIIQHQLANGHLQIYWIVDARKLKGNDKGAVSPSFHIFFDGEHPHVPFKMMLYPKVVNEAKGGSSFKRAHGRGCIQLKCENPLPEHIDRVSFRIAVGSRLGAPLEEWQETRGPAAHRFSECAVCGLAKEEEEWDFSTVVHADSQSFVISLEMYLESQSPFVSWQDWRA